MTEAEIRRSGLAALIDALGSVDAERFIAFVQRDGFDYTRWQRELWPNKSVDELSRMAMHARKSKPTGQP